MILIILAFLLLDLFSVLAIAGDVYLIHEWLEHRNTIDDEYARRCLYGAIALTSFVLLGKFLIGRLVSKSRKNEDEPTMNRSEEHDILDRPDGSKIYVEYSGPKDAQPLVFIHGWNANSMEWYYQKKYFAKEYRLVLIDLPGLGRSTRPHNKDFSLKKMASDLDAVLTTKNIKSPILWGHSIGGMVILTYCSLFMDNLQSTIKGIILEHTTYTNPVKTIILSKLLTAIQKPILEPLCYVIIYLSPIFWAMRWMSYLNGNMLVGTRFLTFTGTQTYQQLNFVSFLSAMAPPAVFARGVLGMFRYDVTNDLGKISVPALIIAADKDRLTKPEASYYMHNRIKGSSLVTVKPGGHQGLVERHAEVNEAASSFIKSLK